jgi:hypothetical protein
MPSTSAEGFTNMRVLVFWSVAVEWVRAYIANQACKAVRLLLLLLLLPVLHQVHQFGQQCCQAVHWH